MYKRLLWFRVIFNSKSNSCVLVIRNFSRILFFRKLFLLGYRSLIEAFIYNREKVIAMKALYMYFIL